MKQILLIASLVLAFTLVGAQTDKSEEKARVRALEQKKTELSDSLKKITDEWNSPKAELSVEEIEVMKHEYDSLYLDLRSRIVTVELQINELYNIIYP